MLNCELIHEDGIVQLDSDGPHQEVDFKALEQQIDLYLLRNGKLHGVLIHAKYFSGWKNFVALFSHLKFILVNLKKIDKVAVITDGVATGMFTTIANYYADAQLRQFDFVSEDAARGWLRKKASTIDLGLN